MSRTNNIVALGVVLAAWLAFAKAAPSSDLSRWFAGMPEGAKTASEDSRDRYEVSCLTPTVYKNCREFGATTITFAPGGTTATLTYNSQTQLFFQTELACCQGVDGGYYHHEPDRILDWVSSPNKVGNCDWTFLRTGPVDQDNNVKRIASVIGNCYLYNDVDKCTNGALCDHQHATIQGGLYITPAYNNAPDFSVPDNSNVLPTDVTPPTSPDCNLDNILGVTNYIWQRRRLQSEEEETVEAKLAYSRDPDTTPRVWYKGNALVLHGQVTIGPHASKKLEPVGLWEQTIDFQANAVAGNTGQWETVTVRDGVTPFLQPGTVKLVFMSQEGYGERY